MDEVFNQDELSAEERAILQAFDAMDMEDWEVESPTMGAINRAPTQELQAELLSPEEMLALFVGEADGDLATIQLALQQMEPDDDLDDARLQIIQRAAHKLKGTTGSVGCMAMSTIAHYIEELIRLLTSGSVTAFIGLNALVQTVQALEMTLNSFITNGKESNTPLTELEEEYKALNVDIQVGRTPQGLSEVGFFGETALKGTSSRRGGSGEDVVWGPLWPPAGGEDVSVIGTGRTGRGRPQGPPPPPLRDPRWRSKIPTPERQEYASSTPFVRVDVRRFEQLVLHTEQLAELRTPLENAQAEVEKALQQLQVAQTRLRHLEALISTHLAVKQSHNTTGQANNDERPTSSLVARILDESMQRTGHPYQRKSKFQSPQQGRGKPYTYYTTGQAGWDELEIEQMTTGAENDVLINSLGEAVADVATASSQLRVALAQINRISQKHVDQAAHVRSDTLLLRLTPISTLCSRIERVVTMSTLAQQRKVVFEVEGGTTEIDQDILEELKYPLLQLVRTCVANTVGARFIAPKAEKAERIWLYVRAVGNEVSIEIGFSMTVGGGALDEVQEAIRRLNGFISARRNTAGGISFYLRLPRSHGTVQSLLVRTGSHRVAVPFSQVQGIVNGKQKSPESLYILNSLLDFPVEQAEDTGLLFGQSGGRDKSGPYRELGPHRPVLILQSGTDAPAAPTAAIAVQVDEILGDVELVVKPLAPHLRRPGIAGAAIGSMGEVLLVLDLPELVNHNILLEPTLKIAAVQNRKKQTPHAGQKQLSVLIADDSVYIRQSLYQTLSHAGYRVTEAVDGIEALEHLVDNPPHALVLDMEMPNLNGYDLLSMMRMHAKLANVKIMMLTSRSSEKHRTQALNLGAHAYLTKPCPQDVLLETLRSLLND